MRRDIRDRDSLLRTAIEQAEMRLSNAHRELTRRIEATEHIPFIG